MNYSHEAKATMNMTASSVGKDLLQALIQEINLLPDVWAKIPKRKQDDVIDRLRKRVETNIKMAVHLIASEGRTVIVGDLDQITLKGGVKAVVKFGASCPNLLDLCKASGEAVLVAIDNSSQYTNGMDEIQGESDQRAMDLGHEYDPNSDGKGMDQQNGNVIDSNIYAIKHQPLSEELKKAYQDGYNAASKEQPQSACPIVDGRLCIEWVKGWKAWHEEQDEYFREVTA